MRKGRRGASEGINMCNCFFPFLDDARDGATHHIGTSYYERDIKADISLFMRWIKRKIGREFNDDYIELKMYYKSQQKIFKLLKKKKKRRRTDDEPGNTSYSEAGIYNGLTWVLMCLGKAMMFNDETNAATMYSYL